MKNLIPIEQLFQSRKKSPALIKIQKATGIRVLIAEARLSMRDSLSRTLVSHPGIQVVAATDNSMQAILKAIELKPDVALIDTTLRDHGGLPAIINIKQRLPGVHILVRNLSDSDSDLIQAFRFGAYGYIPINARVDNIVKIIERAAKGEATLHPDFTAGLVEEFQKNQEDWRKLSGVEKEILKMYSEGFSDSKIAHSLFITENLVREYLRRFLDKLHKHNRVESLAYLQLGRISLTE
jgi:DNA-binding NarL/FixJ family response regulator